MRPESVELSCIYRVVGNFCEVLIFAFFASQEPFAKIKTTKILLPTCKANEPRFQYPAYFYTAAYKSVSASVPLKAITEAIQNAT